MRADIAVGERAEDRVGQRVQRDVGVRMSLQLARIGNLDAAEPDMIAALIGIAVLCMAVFRYAALV